MAELNDFVLNWGKYRGRKMVTNKKTATSSSSTSILSLPKAVIYSILILLPAEILYHVMRYVCRDWNEIINHQSFIKEHFRLHCSNDHGLLIQIMRPIRSRATYYADLGNIDNNFTSNGNTRVMKYGLQFIEKPLSSCHGFLLTYLCRPINLVPGRRSWKWEDLLERDKYLFLLNPVTTKRVSLPSLSQHTNYCFSLLACAPNGEYKVVNAFDGHINPQSCLVLTVGVGNGWRLIECEHLGGIAKLAFRSRPISIGAFICWACNSVPYVLTFDLETEIMYQCPALSTSMHGKDYYYVRMGCYLSVMLRVSDLKWKVWILADFKTGQWTEMPNVDLSWQIWNIIKEEKTRCDDNRWVVAPKIRVVPIAWLREGELVVFRLTYPSSRCIVHNVKTGESCSFEMSVWNVRQVVHAHVNSLLSLNSLINY